jgi:hypothetical protein
MRTLKATLLVLVLGTFGFAQSHHRSSSSSSYGSGSKSSSTTVHSYTKRSGEHVGSYHRTTPDSTQRNNYSAKGNYNPHTGQYGTKPVQH